MYCQHFAISEPPFSITPDPRYLYLGRRHAEALAHLVYGVSEAGGFIQLTGEVGTGKTTTVRSLLARAPQGVQIALILNPKLSPVELLQGVCEELGVAVPRSAGPKGLVDALNAHLLAQHAAGRRVVLIVDEAQNLPPQTLEQLRLLTNLETESQKLLQIILIGQPELREMLARTELRQLAQRITARYHLEPLEAEDTEAYVRHRLRVAGAARELFTPRALSEVHRLSGGVPRLINVLCDRALLAAYAGERTQVDAALVRHAASEVFGRAVAPRWLAPLLAIAGLAILAAGGALAWREHLKSQAHARELAAQAVADSAAAAAQAAARSAPIAQPTLAQQLAGTDTSADAAFGQLFALWGAKYVPGTSDACTAARAQGLSCVTLHSSIARLRELGRPAILMLGGESGGTRQVVLTALGDERVQLRAGAKQVEGKVSDLANAWFGECVLLWRTSANSPGDLHVGMRSPLVPRLRKALAQWQSQQPHPAAADAAAQGEGGALQAAAPAGPVTSVTYDEALKSQVQEFQRAHHLDDDGVAGTETQLMLDGVLAAPETPRLGELKPGEA